MNKHFEPKVNTNLKLFDNIDFLGIFIIPEYALQKRLFIPYESIPPKVIYSFYYRGI